MFNRSKPLLFYILCGAIQGLGAVADFDSFHSNLGEILILSPVKQTTRTLTSPTQVDQITKTPEDDLSELTILPPLPDQAAEEPNEQSSQSPLTDAEIEELLFNELYEFEDTEDGPAMEVPEWYKFYGLEMGWGYAENPLGGASNPVNSQFAELNLETFFLNQKDPRQEKLLYLYAEGKNFYELESEEIAGLVLSQFDYSYKPAGESHSYGLRLQHTFFDLGMDISGIGSTDHNWTKITSNRTELSPNWEWQGENGEEAKLELKWSKEKLRQFADRNSRFGISLTLSNKTAKPVKWQTKIFHNLTRYKDRKPKNGSGTDIEESLKTKSLGLSTKIASAAKNGWSKDLSLNAGIEKVDDNMGDYYDYGRFKASLAKTFETENWESGVSVGYNRTRYSDRLTPNLELFSKDHWSFELGLSRGWDESWKTYAKWIHETDHSNNPNYAFDSSFWSIGMSWEK